MTKKKFLFLTADAGFGHRSASNAVMQALCDLHGNECECKTVNPVFEPTTPLIFQRSQSGYDDMVRHNAAFYEFSYKVSDSVPASNVVSNFVTLFLYKTMQEILAEYRPDAIVSTYHMYQKPVNMVQSLAHSNIPTFMIVTDLSDVHKLWFQRNPEKLFVGSELVRNEAITCGFPAEKIVVSGIPVNPHIAREKRSKNELRQKLGWRSDLTTLLAVSSPRVEHMLENLESINQSGLAVQLAVAAGGDQVLYERLRQMNWQIPVHIYNYANNITEMMQAADVLISKAGGLVTTEGLACGLPILLIDSLPGQESGNITYVCQNQAGVSVQNPGELVDTLRQWLQDEGRLLNQYAEHSKRIGKPEAAYQIAEIVWQRVNEQRLHPNKPASRLTFPRILVR
jgi:1,2-diacylglycerol 3-beta-galactosyltransferase